VRLVFGTPRAVVSGVPYQVREVRDREVLGLEDFLGDTTFVLDMDGDEYRVCGPGVPDDDGVRVFEKDEQGVGKDIRVWTVRRCTGDVYMAEHFGHASQRAVPADLISPAGPS
jgi:hypothetical protein